MIFINFIEVNIIYLVANIVKLVNLNSHQTYNSIRNKGIKWSLKEGVFLNLKATINHFTRKTIFGEARFNIEFIKILKCQMCAYKNNSQADFPNVSNIPTYKLINTTPRETLYSNVVNVSHIYRKLQVLKYYCCLKKFIKKVLIL